MTTISLSDCRHQYTHEVARNYLELIHAAALFRQMSAPLCAGDFTTDRE